MNTLALNLSHNKALIEKAIHKAHEENVELLLLPELCLSGYGCEDMFFSEGFINACQAALGELLISIPSTSLLVTVGFPCLDEGLLYNACALITKGKIIGVVCKQHLAKSGVHYEPRWFTAWPSGTHKQSVIAGQQVPLGDLIFDINDARIAFEICEDAWASNRVANQSSKAGIDLFLNPSASHFAIGKHRKRYELALNASKAFGCAYAYCNLIGCEAGRTIYDGGNMIAQEGQLLLQGKRFSFEKLYMEVVDLDIPPKHHSNDKPFCFVKYRYTPGVKGGALALKAEPYQDEEGVSVALFALALGLWDWQLKTKQKGYVISLSGGADSALCACAVFLAHQLALIDLGIETYKKTLGSLGINTDGIYTNKALLSHIMPQVLTTVYQQSENSSNITAHAATQLAKALGATHHQWSISNEVAAYQDKIEHALGRTLCWEQDDIALQNIQARARSPGVWMLANLEHKLLIATSNLSEASVGYCTMDGDTSGVLSPIGGISKSLVLKLNDYLCQTGLRVNGERIKIADLSAIVNQNPTAELRPTEQRDEADLMPFEVLDAIRVLTQVYFYVKDELLIKLKTSDFNGVYSDAQLGGYIEKYFQLYQRNQWKRERLAVSFHIEHDSACPKTYRRFPVLS